MSKHITAYETLGELLQHCMQASIREDRREYSVQDMQSSYTLTAQQAHTLYNAVQTTLWLDVQEYEYVRTHKHAAIGFCMAATYRETE